MDHFVLEHRGPKNHLDPYRPYASLWEEEPDASGVPVPTAVIFLTNRECPFRCVMCDLWKNTLDREVPRGAIAHQIRSALSTMKPARQIKLYNAGSFFDPRQIPADDDEEIAATLTGFDRVIVESHPAFLAGAYGDRCLRFQSLIEGRLEVAIGLETADPEVLERLNKRMTIEGFRSAAAFLHDHEIALRVFILLNPPFARADDGVPSACRSVDMAAESGATACSIIPTRGGNGAMEAIGDEFVPPRLAELESVIEHGLSRSRRAGPMRVFADLWDIERFFSCKCSPVRATRLATMNRSQSISPRVNCECDRRSVRLQADRQT